MPRRQPENDPDSSTASSAASPALSAPFIGDSGPAFDPEAAAASPPPEMLSAGPDAPMWQEDRVRTIVRTQGLLTHEMIGVGEEDWLWRPGELDSLAEPLANTLNKNPVTRAAAAVSDELAIGATVFEYALRSIRERARVLRAQQQQEAAAQRVARGQSPTVPHDMSMTGYAPEDVGATPAQPVTWGVAE